MRLLLAAALVCAALIPAQAEAKGRPPKCASGGHTLVATGRARVFTAGTGTYACLLHRGKLVRLGAAYGCYSHVCDGVVDPDLVGPYVGYRQYHTDQSSTYGSLASRDLRTGRVVHGFQTPKDGCNWVTSFVLGSGGSLAWIQEDCGAASGTWRVDRLDTTGHTTLDSGAGIDRFSLALSSGRIYWTTNDQPRSAELR